MNFENNEEAGPSGIVMEKEIETDEAAGKIINLFSVFHCLYFIKYMKSEMCILLKSEILTYGNFSELNNKFFF